MNAHWLTRAGRRALALLPLLVVGGLLLAGCSGSTVTLRQMVGNASYWPPACTADPCTLTGLGGVTDVWERYVDDNLALGRSFVVVGVCASACEIAARRAHARILPGARLIPHTPTPTVFS